jgi:hypothetical protein
LEFGPAPVAASTEEIMPESEKKPDVAASSSWSSMHATTDEGPMEMNVQSDGAIGKDVGSKACPPGSMCSLKTHEGTRKWTVTSHSPHAHENMSVPQLSQMSGPKVPDVAASDDDDVSMSQDRPMHTLAHVAKLAKHSSDWGHKPECSFTSKAAPMAASQPVEIDAKAAAKRWLGINE